MQFEVIRKSHKKEILAGVGAIILIAIVLLVRNSFAKYQTTKSMKIAEGTINYKVPDFKIMAMYKNDGDGDVPIDTMPDSGYNINIDKSYCELNGSKDNNASMYTDETGQHIISKLSKGDRCYLYFDKELCSGSACKEILADITPKESPDSFTGIADTDEGIFKTQDDDGETYYWRGAVTNNYVKFANKYWRIIRINGDGTIRMIYDGETARENGSKLTVETSRFNSSSKDKMYLGFKYTSGNVHGTESESTILGKLKTWYTNNLKSYEDKIDPNTGFCNDREPSTRSTTSNGSGGTGSTDTYYGAYIRIDKGVSEPTFKCKNSSDLFTVSGAVKKDGTTANGNRSLEYPIGLITADEVVYAGGYYFPANSSYYLYTGQAYWALSPWRYRGGNAYMSYVYSDGLLRGDSSVNNSYGVRPVINLKADTKFTYEGTGEKGNATNPYVVI